MSYISGGKCKAAETKYAAECTKHDLIIVSHTSQKPYISFKIMQQALGRRESS